MCPKNIDEKTTIRIAFDRREQYKHFAMAPKNLFKIYDPTFPSFRLFNTNDLNLKPEWWIHLVRTMIMVKFWSAFIKVITRLMLRYAATAFLSRIACLVFGCLCDGTS